MEPEKEGFVHWLGFLFLMLLIVLVTFNDIVRLIKG
jgi:regulator of sigma E protease